MNSYIKLILCCAFALNFIACHKDSLTEGKASPDIHNPEIMSSVSGSVLGYVYGDDNKPISGATVSVLGNLSSSDEYGLFKFDNIELDPNGSYLKVEKSGHILGSDMIYALKDKLHFSRVFLMQLDSQKSFDSGNGGNITIDGGGSIVFQSSSIVNSSGSDYNGRVYVTAKRLATDDPLISDKMPGALVAQDSEGRTVALGSMGMVAVALRDESGNKLNIKEGKTAKVSFEIAPHQLNEAPEQIELWSFDEERGIWVEEGVATKNGGQYIANVPHFSFWNCDVPYPLVTICGKVLYEGGIAASQIQISLFADGLGIGWGWTNADGSFSGKVPQGSELQVEIFNSLCSDNESIKSFEIGPFETKTTLDDIIIPSPNVYTINGIVQCSGQGLSNASVVYTVNETSYVIEASENGEFIIYLNTSCEAVDEISVFAIDPEMGNASLSVIIPIGANPNPILDVCDDCSFAVSIESDPDSDPCTEKVVTADVSGNGNYTFLWQDQSTNQSIQVENAGLYCVTVTDTDLDCSLVRCSEETWFTPLFGELWSTASCGGEDGTLNAYFGGGSKPYAFQWSDPSITGEIDSFGVNVPSGTYSVTVTDSNNCSIIKETMVEESEGFDVFLEVVQSCKSAELHPVLTGGQEPFSFVWPINVQSGFNYKYVSEDGTYCVDVYDANGCMVTKCVDVIIEVNHDAVELEIENCDKGNYTIKNSSSVAIEIRLNLEVDTSYLQDSMIIIDDSEISLNMNESIDFNFTKYGFRNYVSTAFSEEYQCIFISDTLKLPALIPDFSDNSKTFTVIQKSCSTCEDAMILVNNNYTFYPSINGANAGDVFVLDDQYLDVTDAASAGSLSSGSYYVVVADSNIGCYIYSEEVIVN